MEHSGLNKNLLILGKPSKQICDKWWRKSIFLGSMLPQYIALFVCFVCSFCVSKKIKECCQLLHDITRLHLMVPIDFWQDSTPFG